MNSASDLPRIRTIAQVLASRETVLKYAYQDRPVIFIDWCPAADGTHCVALLDGTEAKEVFLPPNTWLEERPAQLLSFNSATGANSHAR